jgi:hypothetical protein
MVKGAGHLASYCCCGGSLGFIKLELQATSFTLPIFSAHAISSVLNVASLRMKVQTLSQYL